MIVLFNKPYGVLSQFTNDGGRWQTLAEYIDIPNVYAAGRLDADSEGLLLLTDNGVLQAAIAGAEKTNSRVPFIPPSNFLGRHGLRPRDDESAMRRMEVDTSKTRSLRGAQSAARQPRNSVLSAESTLPPNFLGRHGLRPRDDENRLQSAEKTKLLRVTKTYWAQVEGIATDEHASQLMRGVQLNDGAAKAINAKPLGQLTEPWPRDPPIRVRQSVPDSWLELTLDEGRNRQVRRMTAAVALPTLRLIRVAVGPWRVDDLPLGTYRTMSDDDAFRVLKAGR